MVGAVVCLAVSAFAPSAHAQSTVSDGPDAMPAVVRVPVAAAMQGWFGASLTGGYGFYESTPDAPGSHHRVNGSVAIALRPLRWLGFSLRFDGRYDWHDTPQGPDDGAVGDPRLSVRLGGPLTSRFGLGLQSSLWMPSEQAPSFSGAALSFENSLFASVRPVPAVTLSFEAGFRVDRSAASAPDAALLSAADRLVLGVSAFHSLMFGIGVVGRIGVLEVLGEWRYEPWVGDGAPGPATAPMHLRAGVRVAAVRGGAVSVGGYLDGSLNGRPSSAPSAPLAATDPRFAAVLTLNFRAPVSASASGLAGGRVEGTVRRNTGRPAANARVVLQTEEGDRREASTNSDGRFVLSDVPPGEHRLEISGAGLRPYQSTVRTGANAAPVAVVVETDPTAMGVFRGRVRSEGGQPLAANVHVTGPSGRVFETRAGNDGTFEIASLPPGDYDVRVESDGHRTMQQSVHVEAGDSAQAELALPAASAGAQIRGAVRAFNGRALQATVQIAGRGSPITADADGRFRFDVPPGSYEVTITASGYETQRRRVQVEADGVVILNVDLRRGR